MKKTGLLTGIVIVTVLLSACTGMKNAAFSGSMTGDEKNFEIAFDVLNTTYTHELEMKQGEIIQVHIVKKSGDLKVMIQKDGEAPVYEGNGDAAADFSVTVPEDGAYTVRVTGNAAEGQVTFNGNKKR